MATLINWEQKANLNILTWKIPGYLDVRPSTPPSVRSSVLKNNLFDIQFCKLILVSS